MGEKRGKGKGDGAVFGCPHTMGSPCLVRVKAKICAASSHAFVAENTQSPHVVVVGGVRGGSVGNER